MPNYCFNVLFRPEPEGGFTAMVPALPGCITYGKTLSKAKAMAKDAIECYLEALVVDDKEIPNEKTFLYENISVTLNRRKFASRSSIKNCKSKI